MKITRRRAKTLPFIYQNVVDAGMARGLAWSLGGEDERLSKARAVLLLTRGRKKNLKNPDLWLAAGA
ncbi:hypothetical protein C5167_043259 [Papaver somniferum]|uniref:Uncharacterized protein n=1 Tax=Papaver somniferum TaxID=3469 RepID=A0A4Y7L7T5_PAPSO|nr:hypothetical protein C5167_043259 [Papaver somniferum]